MKFNKLSKAAKQRALEWWTQLEGEEFDGSEHYEDLATGLKYLGIDVDTRTVARSTQHGTRCVDKYEFEWSGFYSQGDGLAFKGSWRAEDMDLGALVENRGAESPLLAVGQQLMLVLLKHPLGRCTITTTNYGPGLPRMGVDDAFTRDDDGPAGNDLEMDNDTYIALREAFKAAAHICWCQLRDAYEDATSEENAIACIEANGYSFSKDGTIIPSRPRRTRGCANQMSTS